MVAYHDTEWGRPLHDEQRLFEMLCLEGAQAGLSWSTVLRRRAGYRAAYDGFDAERIAAYDDDRQARLLADPRIIRNGAKVRAFRDNARATVRLRDEAGGLDAYLWAFVDGRPIVNRFALPSEVPAQTPLAGTISRELRQRGFHFVGPVIIYALMQSVGLVDDHLVSCFRHDGAAGR
jgi:DNA-3-methyladenine glycosylase I